MLCFPDVFGNFPKRFTTIPIDLKMFRPHTIPIFRHRGNSLLSRKPARLHIQIKTLCEQLLTDPGTIMIDRLMPLFAVIGVLSSIVYLTLAVWMVYENLPHVKKKHSA